MSYLRCIVTFSPLSRSEDLNIELLNLEDAEPPLGSVGAGAPVSSSPAAEAPSSHCNNLSENEDLASPSLKTRWPMCNTQELSQIAQEIANYSKENERMSSSEVKNSKLKFKIPSTVPNRFKCLQNVDTSQQTKTNITDHTLPCSTGSPTDLEGSPPPLTLNNDGQDKRVCLDVPTLIAYVSNISNGGSNFEFDGKFLQEQAKWEREHPIKATIERFWQG